MTDLIRIKVAMAVRHNEGKTFANASFFWWDQ